MPLLMARPWKHPKTGVYWFRRGVPADLQPRVGKREELRTLKTNDQPPFGGPGRLLVDHGVLDRWGGRRSWPGLRSRP
jgi:hypothetical protein